MIVLGLQDLNEDEFDDAIEIMSNSHLNNNFLNLARELDIMEPKTPEDVYKSHLVTCFNFFAIIRSWCRGD